LTVAVDVVSRLVCDGKRIEEHRLSF